MVNWKLGDGPRVNAPWASPRAGRTAYRARRARLGRTNAGRARGSGARAYNQLFWAQSWPCFQELELPRASSKPFSSCCARSELVPSAWAGIRPGACLCGLGVKRRPREGARTILSPSSTTRALPMCVVAPRQGKKISSAKSPASYLIESAVSWSPAVPAHNPRAPCWREHRPRGCPWDGHTGTGYRGESLLRAAPSPPRRPRAR